MKTVKLRSDIYVGNTHVAARDGKPPRYGPAILYELPDEIADDLLARGDAVAAKADAKSGPPRRLPTKAKDSETAPRVRKAVSEPAHQAIAEAKERSEPKAPE